MNQFFKSEISSSILLAIGLVCALILANWSLSSNAYLNVLHLNLGGLTLHLWINDGLMAIFFYMIGMEVKREVISGSLSSVKKAVLPIFAALGGMLVPALLFLYFNHEALAARAWGVPMATDIAFALGALVAIGKFAPLQLRAFLLALAVIDDIGAILVIAFFYSKGLNFAWLSGFAFCAVLAFLFNQKLKWSWKRHIALGIIAWACMMFSGIHATLAGVIWGLLTPPHETGIHKLHPWVSFLILPIFALANSGVILPSFSQVSALITDHLMWAIVLALFLGKPIGIVVSSFLSVKLKWGELPQGIRFTHLWGLGLLAGIGFTMAIFIAELSLSDPSFLNSAKLGILLGSLISAIAGAAFLIFIRPTQSTERN